MIIKKNKQNATLKNTNNTLLFKRNLSAALISSSLLFACGGSDAVVTPDPINISGTASKGLILGGNVNAYLINTDGSKAESSIGTATTDTTDGSYELTLDTSYNGEPLIIEITAADGSQMKCDLSVCLADDDAAVEITFGELYPLPSTFELSAVSSGSDSATISINITPLTNIAAALTLDKVAGGSDPAAAAEAANYQIANLLGLDGDITMLPIVDLTDATAVNGATADALNANLKSAAVVEAALSDSTAGTSIEDALDSFVTQYVASNGVADTEGAGVDTPSVSLEEIAAASQVLTSKVTELDGVSAEDENIASVNTALIAEETDKATGSTDATQGDVPDDVGSEGLIATKAFVSQVSTFSLATQLDGANTFKNEIDLASDLASNDLDANSQALSLATAAIAEALIVNNAKPTPTYTFEGIIDVAISVSGDTVTYTVAQTLDVEDDAGVATTTTINLVAVNAVLSNTIEDSETESETGNSYTWSSKGEASLDLAISGSVSTAKASITINDGSQFVATLTVDEEEEYNSESYTASGLISVTGVDIALSVSIAQVATTEVTDPITFTGAFNIAATLLSVDYDEAAEHESNGSANNSSWSSTDEGTETIKVDGLTASLSGIFSNSSESLEATVALAASGFEETCTWDNEWSGSYTVEAGNTETHTESDECGLVGETAETYGSASITVRFALDVDGIESDVELEANIQRTGLESGVASIDLTYGGNQLDFDFNTADIVETESEGDIPATTSITATLTNHNGVILTFTNVETDNEADNENNETSSVTTGVISHEGEEFATVSDEGVVTFSDGTFVTL